MAQSKKRGTVDLDAHQRLLQAQQAIADGQVPYVHPSVTDPKAIGHAVGVAARRGKGGLPKYTDQVAGGPPPPMPALEHPHQENQTMASQAVQTHAEGDHKAMQHAMAQHHQSGSIIQAGGAPMTHPVQQTPVQRTPAQLGIMPADTLHPDAQKDENFHHGAGSMLAQHQPHMALKYGVIRKGVHIPPQALQANVGVPPSDFRQNMGRRPSQEVLEDMRRVSESMGRTPQPSPGEGLRTPDSIPKTDEEADEMARRGPAGAAAEAGRPPAPSVLSEDENARKKAEEQLKDLDTLDLEMLRREMIKDILRHPDQREMVEKRCVSMSLDDLLMRNSVQQKVPVVPGKFEPTFESMTGDVEIRLKQMLTQESDSTEVTESYLLDKYALMTTTAGTSKINNLALPSIYDGKGDFSEELFWKKYRWMVKKPIHMLASLGIHYSWFEMRVRRLFKAEDLKNG